MDDILTASTDPTMAVDVVPSPQVPKPSAA